MDKRTSVRFKLAEFIYYIVSKVKVIGAVDFKLIEYPVFVKALVYKPFIIILYLFLFLIVFPFTLI